jgi:RNA polymerase sigma-70 factor (ECF subfamily)
MTLHNVVSRWFEENRAFLWGLAYRVTGSAADADDVVQDTFIRALEHPPAILDEPRGWLVKVAVNRARDVLRRRRRRNYVGSWLPGPIATSAESESAMPSFEPVVDGHETLEGRYDLMESVSLAFLQALEALTPTQRAVLLLADVFDYSAAEVAAALDLTPGNARTIHHRAKRAMETYDKARAIPSAAARQRTGKALEKFLQLLRDADINGIEHMLAADVRAVGDGGGEYSATRRPIIGAPRVAMFFGRLRATRRGFGSVRLIEANGFPVAVIDFDTPMGRRPSRLMLAVNVNGTNLVSRVWVVANSRKLQGLVNLSAAS